MIYLAHLIQIPDGTKLYYPNIPLFLVVNFLGSLLSLAKQETHHQEVEVSNIVLWHLLALMPPLFLLFGVNKLKRREIKRGNDFSIIWAFRILEFILYLLTVLFFALFLTILFLAMNPVILVLPLYSSLGILGWSLGTYLSMIREEPSKWIVFLQTKLISPLIGKKWKRKLLVGFALMFSALVYAIGIPTLFSVSQT
ncbi:MAG: hypothetical protein ACXAE3_14000 [Candidatus Kariarchaeaceae archaeon]